MLETVPSRREVEFWIARANDVVECGAMHRYHQVCRHITFHFCWEPRAPAFQTMKVIGLGCTIRYHICNSAHISTIGDAGSYGHRPLDLWIWMHHGHGGPPATHPSNMEIHIAECLEVVTFMSLQRWHKLGTEPSCSSSALFAQTRCGSKATKRPVTQYLWKVG